MKHLQQFLGFIYHTMKIMARVTSGAAVRAAINVVVLMLCDFLFVTALAGWSGFA